MDDQKTTPGGNEACGGHSNRRRIAIGAALLLMGAVIIDPGLLDDAHVSVEVNPGINDEPVDAFEQIELMLAQAEGNKDSPSSPPSTTEATTDAIPYDSQKAPSGAEPMTLMIPGQGMSTDSDHSPSLKVPSNNENSALPVKAVSFPGDVIEIPAEQPSMASRELPNTEQRDARSTANIRFLGTIDPHH